MRRVATTSSEKRAADAESTTERHRKALAHTAGTSRTSLHLLGNQAAQRVGHALPVQAKLAVTPPNDPYEQEADRLADQVMRMSAPDSRHGCSSCCTSCAQEPRKVQSPRVQTKFAHANPSAATAAPPIVHEALRSSGAPLDAATRSFMESRFGADFGGVRIHTDHTAAASAAAIGARAYTAGQDVVFGTGEFQPHTEHGRWLLAHELAHVGQQGATAPGLIQRAPLEGTNEVEIEEDIEEEQPTAEEVAAHKAGSEVLKQQLYEKYWGLVWKIAAAQQLGRVQRRQEWSTLLEQKLSSKIDSVLSKKEVGFADVIPLHDALDKVSKEIEVEKAEAESLWERTNIRYAEERDRLQELGTYEAELALEHLDLAFDREGSRVIAVLASDMLVQDDVLGLVHLLDNRTYESTAKRIIDSEREATAAQLDELSIVKEEGPGFLETAWSIIGCDSLGECALDAGLAVATAGVGKGLKLVVKGGKAVKTARKAKKVVRSAKQLQANIRRLLKEAKALKKFGGVVKKAAEGASFTYHNWLKMDWDKMVYSYVANLNANYMIKNEMSGEAFDEMRGSLLEFLSKQLGVSEPNAQDIHVATLAVLRKNFGLAAHFTRNFIIQSLQYRMLLNLVAKLSDIVIPKEWKGEADEKKENEKPKSLKEQIQQAVAAAAKGAVFDTGQDLIQALPFVGGDSGKEAAGDQGFNKNEVYKYFVEVMKKAIQKTVGW